MRFFYRLITPVVTLLIALLSAKEGDYIIALAASVILGLICYNLMDVTDPVRIPPPELPEIIAKGPGLIHFNNTNYPDWLQTDDGHFYVYYGIDSSKITEDHPNRMDEDGLVYKGMKYTLAGPDLA